MRSRIMKRAVQPYAPEIEPTTEPAPCRLAPCSRDQLRAAWSTVLGLLMHPTHPRRDASGRDVVRVLSDQLRSRAGCDLD
jgi:hypothetical protein